MRTITTFILVVLLAGCGGGGGGGKSTSPATPTAIPTVSGANPTISAENYQTVVKQVLTQVQALAASAPAHATPAEAARFTLSLQASIKGARDQLADLRPPGNLGVGNRAVVDALTKYADLLGQLAVAAKNHDPKAGRRISAAISAETAKLQIALKGAGQ